MKTVYFKDPTKENIEAAAKIIRDGGLLAIPTETVYGLGADALNEDAVLRIFLAKGRPQDNPLIIHVPDSSWLARYCEDVPPEAYALAEKFWPGPLTMILPRKPSCRCARRADWRQSASAARTTPLRVRSSPQRTCPSRPPPATRLAVPARRASRT